jgi:hypothetical protein
MKVTPFLLTEDDLELEVTAVSDLPRQCRYSNRKLMPERSTRPMRRSVSAQSEPGRLSMSSLSEIVNCSR